jgi:hypothetical protein
MASLRSKKTFFILSIVVPFLLYCFYYYGMMVKNAPYKFVEFESIVFKYGDGDSLLNKYNSKTGEYQFVNSRDSVIHSHLKLTKDDLLYLHRKAADLGFWDFPNHIVADSMAIHTLDRPTLAAYPKFGNAPRYYIQFNYKRKSKTVYYDDAYSDNPKLKDAAQRLIREIQDKLKEAEKR